MPTVEAPANVDSNMIEKVLVNLVLNARDAMPGGGRITLSLDAVVTEPHETAEGVRPGGVFTRLSVGDTGAGIAPRRRCPTSSSWVEVESAPGRGATFHVYLPRAPGV